MVELEAIIIPTVTDSIPHWRRYVHMYLHIHVTEALESIYIFVYTCVFIKKSYAEHVLARLNYFHKNIQLTHELEDQNKLPFLEVLLMRRGNKIETTVYRNDTDNDIYLIGVHLHQSHGKEVL